MDSQLAAWLVSPAAEPALAAAAAEPDPDSLGAAQRMRREFPPEQAAAALTQAGLRRKAVTKFGERAGGLFFTGTGLEQATRAEVAGWRAARFAAAGVTQVADLGCGLGADALAFLDAGLEVQAVDADPVTAILAAANLGRPVACAKAEDAAEELLARADAVFLDPARRTEAGRTWRVGDLSPSWEFATGLIARRWGCIKAAPGLPSTAVPAGAGVTWVSHRGDLVETTVWSSGNRGAVLLPGEAELAGGPSAPVGEVGRYLYEPDPAVIRAGSLGRLADLLQARAVQPGIAYLSGDTAQVTQFATVFEVIETMAFDERTLRAWVREHGVGILEIKVRGLEVDPAVLRRRLKPSGAASATLVLTPTSAGARALVVRRL
jgi:SAM-dependent methyltransferases related to tRNA (uracil-5-)-methyltransferase